MQLATSLKMSSILNCPDIPKGLLRAVVKVGSRHHHVAQVRSLEGGDIGLFFGDKKAAVALLPWSHCVRV